MERAVKRIVLPGDAPGLRPAHAAGGGRGVRAPRWLRFAGWFLPPAMLAAVAVGVLLVTSGPGWLLGAALSMLFGLGFGWMLVSVLYPARADRRCTHCGADALARIDPDATSGLLCRACGRRDETASAWLLAEEEGPLERTVLRERALRRRRRSAPPPPAHVSEEGPQ